MALKVGEEVLVASMAESGETNVVFAAKSGENFEKGSYSGKASCGGYGHQNRSGDP